MEDLKKINFLYFFICIAIIALLIYGEFLYNIYIHPTEILNTLGEKEILLFGDFKYLFKVIKCHNLGFNVYSSHDCYKDYYGSYVYGPSILFLPSISKDVSNNLTDFFFAPILIITFVYLNIKLINPNNLYKYFLTTLILFNPTTLFLYEKLNIDIVIYISLIFLVYFTKNNLFKLIMIFFMTLTKFYPAILSIIFLLEKKKIYKNIIFFLLSIFLTILFIYFFWENLIVVKGTLKYISQSFKYNFSLNSLNKIFIFITNLENIIFTKIIFITISLVSSYLIYFFLLKSKTFINENNLNNDTNFFILSSSLSISLYLIFGNNFYREIYLIGIIPFILKNTGINILRYILYLFIFKYIYLLIFFPYYYNADLNINKTAQVLIGLKSLIDYFLISILNSVLFIFINIYFKKYLNYFKKNEY